jgi:ATP-dependent RNA helicase DDX6/DHH1
VLVPTRELALQTSYVIKNLGKFKKLECMVSTGGTKVSEDFYRLNQTVHVIVATPGRICDLIQRNVANVSKCKFVVLDEVDKLLSSDFREIVEKIIRLLPSPQIALFSATYPQEIKSFQETFIPKPLYIKPTDELTLKGLTQYYAYLEEKEKLHCLTTLFNKLEISQAIIFCNTGKRTELLANKIHSMGYSCFYIHSRME